MKTELFINTIEIVQRICQTICTKYRFFVYFCSQSVFAVWWIILSRSTPLSYIDKKHEQTHLTTHYNCKNNNTLIAKNKQKLKIQTNWQTDVLYSTFIEKKYKVNNENKKKTTD